MYQTPALLLSVILGSIPAALFQMWKGRTAADFLIYEMTSLFGFLLGQAMALAAGWQLLMIGQVHPLEGLLGSVGMLFLVRWLRA